MSDWIERINTDLVAAMKAHETLKTSVLRMLKSDLNKLKIDKGDLSEQDALSVFKRAVKQREDSIAAYAQAGRPDMAAAEAAEMEIVKTYLPAELGEDELAEIVSAVIAEAGARSKADFGKVMKPVMNAVAGRADGKRVKDAVEKALSAL